LVRHLAHIARWLGDSRANLLTILGDLGTGKSTLARFLAYNLAKSFCADPLRHPVPVLIPLKEVRKEVSLEGIIIGHFSRRGLSGVILPRFEHLVRLGKVVLLFDAFDEMADRVRWEITHSSFRELRRAAEGNGKVVLTCRTHYFKDRNEQVRLIGAGPRLSEIETELYRELRQQSGTEVAYLQEFDDNQIQAYIAKARSSTATEDWEKIKYIYNLKELAQRPLLLDMIVKSLPKLEAGQNIDAANLYTVYTNI
jgi:predicted NACHT family NTPase